MLSKMLTAGEMMKVLRIGKTAAYELLNREDFPTVRIGRKLLVPEDALQAWIERGGTTQAEA